MNAAVKNLPPHHPSHWKVDRLKEWVNILDHCLEGRQNEIIDDRKAAAMAIVNIEMCLSGIIHDYKLVRERKTGFATLE
jgi:hypothetical protein